MPYLPLEVVGLQEAIDLLGFFYSTGDWLFYKDMSLSCNSFLGTLIVREGWGYDIHHLYCLNKLIHIIKIGIAKFGHYLLCLFLVRIIKTN